MSEQVWPLRVQPFQFESRKNYFSFFFRIFLFSSRRCYIRRTLLNPSPCERVQTDQNWPSNGKKTPRICQNRTLRPILRFMCSILMVSRRICPGFVAFSVRQYHLKHSMLKRCAFISSLGRCTMRECDFFVFWLCVSRWPWRWYAIPLRLWPYHLWLIWCLWYLFGGWFIAGDVEKICKRSRTIHAALVSEWLRNCNHTISRSTKWCDQSFMAIRHQFVFDMLCQSWPYFGAILRMVVDTATHEWPFHSILVLFLLVYPVINEKFMMTFGMIYYVGCDHFFFVSSRRVNFTIKRHWHSYLLWDFLDHLDLLLLVRNAKKNEEICYC